MSSASKPKRAGGKRAARTLRRQGEAELEALLQASRVVLERTDFARTARSIYDSCKHLLGTNAGYVALLSADGSENELLFLDRGDLPCSVDPSLPMPIRGLRAQAYRSAETVYDNSFAESEWVKLMPQGHIRLDNVLFAPMTLEGKTVGVLGFANKPGEFTEHDAYMASAFGRLAAIALQNSRTLQALEHSRERFETLVQTAIDAIITADERGVIISWNRAAEKLFGHTAEEAKGHPVTMIIPERLRQRHLDGMKRVLAGEPGRIIGKTTEVSGLRKDGTEVPLELSLASWRTEEGVYFTSIVRDITERRRGEDALRESEERFRVMFESANDMIAIFDMDNNVVWANPAWQKTLGYTALSLGDPSQRIHPEDRARVLRAWKRLAAGEGSVTIRRFRFQKADASYATLETTLTSVTAAGQTFRYVVSVDLTELDILRREVGVTQGVHGIIGRDPRMLQVFETVHRAAPVDFPVLIEGESGTGKELVAAAIHGESARAGKPFVVVNCSGIPDGLLESELFGYVKGAFSGALHDRQGRFEQASRGTIFLDEIGELSPSLQVKLLRVLQDGTFQRVGGEASVKVDSRLIAATRHRLQEKVAQGRFREDLYFRLAVLPIRLPPLRERPLDIPVLAQHFLERETVRMGRERVALSHQALSALINYPWPGNVRELQTCLMSALVECRGDLIDKTDLPERISHLGQPPLFVKRRKRTLTAAAVRDALQQTGGNKLKAARLLGVSRATLYRFLSSD